MAGSRCIYMPAQELKAFLAKREEEGVEPLADVAENVPF